MYALGLIAPVSGHVCWASRPPPFPPYMYALGSQHSYQLTFKSSITRPPPHACLVGEHPPCSVPAFYRRGGLRPCIQVSTPSLPPLLFSRTARSNYAFGLIMAANKQVKPLREEACFPSFEAMMLTLQEAEKRSGKKRGDLEMVS